MVSALKARTFLLALFLLPLPSQAEPQRPSLRGNLTSKTTGDAPPHRVHMVSGSTRSRPWTHNVTRNQQIFSSLHAGMDYTYVDGDAARFLLQDNYAPQWLKIRVLQNLLRRELMDGGAKCKSFVVWIDDDIVVTSPKNFVEDMIARMSSEAEMMMSADAGDPKSGVNTGIMLLRVTPKSLQMLDDVWAMSTQTVGDATLGTCRNQACLHEQEAVNILRRTSTDFEAKTQVVYPVEDDFNINTFYRATHHDPKRRMWVFYDEDPGEFRWDPKAGWNTCHVTGMEQELRKEFIDECLDVAEDAFMREARGQGHPREHGSSPFIFA